MTGLVRARYTLELKQEAVRLVRGGQTVSSVAKTLGLSDQTLHNWLKAEAAGSNCHMESATTIQRTESPLLAFCPASTWSQHSGRLTVMAD